MQKCYNIMVTGKVQDIGFRALYTDEFWDIGRKLDIGVDVLRDIKADTSVLSSFVVEQRVHNQQLEKILEKLADR